MFLGHQQVLFYTGPPNSKLLFSERGNGPIFRPFGGFWRARSASGLSRIKKFLESDVSGGPFYKNTLILTFDFHLNGPGGTPGALGVCRIKNQHKKSHKPLILEGTTFI